MMATFTIQCTECQFEGIAKLGSGEMEPVDVIRDHGRETGHILEIDAVPTEVVTPAD